MDNAISRLLKVLTLERKQGYRNKAVIGGLDKFVSRWEGDARAEAVAPALVTEIVQLLLGYAAVDDLPTRERILDLVIRKVHDSGVEAGAESDEMARQRPAEGEERSPLRPAEPPRERPGYTPSEPRHEPGPDAWQTGPAGNPPSSPFPATPAGSHGTAPTPPAPDIRPPVAPPGARPGVRPPNWSPVEARTGAGAPFETLRPNEARPGEGQPAPVPPYAAAPEGEPPRDPRPLEARGQPAPAYEPLTPARPPEPRPPSPTEAAPRPNPIGLDAPVTRLPGVGPAFAQKLAKLGVESVRDLLYLLPHRYDDFSQLRTIDRLKLGEEVTVIATVWDIQTRMIGDDRRMVTARVGDGTGEMQMTWFNPYVERQLRVGQAYSFAGRIEAFRSSLVIRHPAFEQLDRGLVSTGRLVPVHPTTEGISGQWLRKIIGDVLQSWGGTLPDFLPAEIREEYNLVSLGRAITQIHFPDGKPQLAAAHRRLSFDEFLVLQLGVLSTRRKVRGEAGRPLTAGPDVFAPFLAELPFGLTAAQQRALGDIASDLAAEVPMSRLLQGDVGSGKTAVAAAALWAAVANGAQGAIMAPTEILAEQHARGFARMFEGLLHPIERRSIRVVALTGSQGAAEREAALAALASGEADVAVGTHALIQRGVAFRSLAVAVVDEQHRFGVEQRAALRQKGAQPHILVMSATPIPRSLALTIYGDLDMSVIDEMPAGRTPIRTKWLTSKQRERAYDFIRRQAAEGRQAFIIYPLVEESSLTDARAAVDEHVRLQKTIFPELRVGLVHGRLKGEEKDAAMRAFSSGELDVLVATSVVEVGIDVPNATVIMIEGAERFGLAQLHQFRGRVGRGPHPSYCILISDAGKRAGEDEVDVESESVRRLVALEETTDGFALAQLDLELRGPGDFFGTRQSGLPPLKTAQLSDLRTLEEARAAAQALFAADPALEQPEHSALAEQVAEFWSGAGDVS